FAIVVLGYSAVRFGLFPKPGVGGLIAFVNNFATPCLLFRAMYAVDFAETFQPTTMLPFYFGALVCGALGIVSARVLFSRRPGEAVASGFSAFFANTVLVGIPVIERAYGQPAMTVTFAIISVHAAILFTTGMIAMEIARRDGAPMGTTLLRAGRAMVANPILWGVFLGLLGNVSGFEMPTLVDATTALIALAIVPVALFGLGGALTEYRIVESWPEAAVVSTIKLMVHPAITWVLMVPVLGVQHDIAKVVVLLAAMPSGINTYIFATYYNRNTGVAANAVLISTVAGFVTISFWLWVLTPG
ncbi:MAG TPA: AEC family transporter, partial [Devosiaceae bacterium]|nr:AEC family transporter [Devosiaceae bacterium]